MQEIKCFDLRKASQEYRFGFKNSNECLNNSNKRLPEFTDFSDSQKKIISSLLHAFSCQKVSCSAVQCSKLTICEYQMIVFKHILDELEAFILTYIISL